MYSMDIKAMTSAIDEKYEQVKTAIDGDDLLKIRELSLELHAMVHPAEVSGTAEKIQGKPSYHRRNLRRQRRIQYCNC